MKEFRTRKFWADKAGELITVGLISGDYSSLRIQQTYVRVSDFVDKADIEDLFMKRKRWNEDLQIYTAYLATKEETSAFF